ncbi:hypothetical protein GW17_00051176 [Ensete ventricosum]|nr:hypothetical protein GW17_00051176 [Ensete ventricosum]
MLSLLPPLPPSSVSMHVGLTDNAPVVCLHVTRDSVPLLTWSTNNLIDRHSRSLYSSATATATVTSTTVVL